MATSQFNFEIFFVFLGVWWVDLQIFLNFIDLKTVSWDIFLKAKGSFHIDIELFGEIIGIVNSEDSLIEVNILWDIEILPRKVFLGSQHFGDLLTIDENALDNSGVFDSWFGHMDGFIIKIEVNDARSNTIIF